MQLFRFPVFRLVICFAIGIASQRFLELKLSLLVWTLAILTFVWLTLWKFDFKTMRSLVSLFLFINLGAFCLVSQDETNRDSHFTHHILLGEKASGLQLEVREKLKKGAKFQKYVCSVRQADANSVTGKILLYVDSRKHEAEIPIGQLLELYAIAYPLKPVMNPGQFDYSAYLRNKGIYAQIYASDFRESGLEKNIWHFSDKIRKRIIANASNGFGKKELAVFAALVLGQQQDIDQKIVEDYQFSGAVHILSVSGLHVGFLMLFLEFLFGFLPNSKRWNFTKLVLVVIALWGFALLAGLSPSVVRSVTMFSLVAIGMHLGRNSNIYNTLAVSALLILVFRPTFLFDVGFQLSYAALFFIVWLKPLFDKIAHFDNRIARYFWNILTVSFAAQIGTLPLTLYYFHQFPALFFITNLIALPVLGIVMILGMLTSIWACFGSVPYFLSWVTSESIYWMDFAIAKVADQEIFVLRNLWFTFTMLVLSYILVVAIGLTDKKIKFGKLAVIGSCVLALQLYFLFGQMKNQKAKEWLVFQANRNTIIANRFGREVEIFSTDAKSKSIQLSANPYAIDNRGDLRFSSWRNLHTFDKVKIQVIDSSGFSANVQSDVLLLVGSPKINLERKLLELSPKVVIADGSNYKYAVKNWAATCRKRKIPFHATAEKGFFVLKNGP
ncbi:ComEC/Rec2 family competence protein [Flavobacterium sp.]|uniref:ComEC/Rec2 family competence protein n=1 Tax=Flavobacterium sp. TaxID=239 RepID=UPI0012135870|nr:ComEC/Rec2 family competence protein [Flavobacterium sp.]RZJ71616.1 MAG: ComEC family competence protein [Flavobacterium sp.]